MLLAVDDISIWPAEILALFRAAQDTLRGDQKHREDHDRAIEQDFTARFTFSRNPYRYGRDQLTADVHQALDKHSLIGWHGTRLCDDEVDTMRASGIHLLSPETLGRRVERRLHFGDLTSLQAAEIIKRHSADSPNRKGQFWCVFNRSLLADHGMRDLFGMWGGEALYREHHDNPAMEAVLRSIGKARIIQIAAPHVSVKVSFGVAACMVRVFKKAHGIADENRPECEGHVFDALGSDCLIRVITDGDPEFADLTGGIRSSAKAP